MTRFNWYRYIFVAILALVSLASAAQTFELLGVQNVVQGRRFAVTFRLSNAQANPPQAPKLDRCHLFSGPEISTMEYQMNNNGRVSRTVMYDFTYVYIADEPGDVRVPALSVNAGGKTLSSRPATFKILPPDKNAQTAPAPGQPRQQPGRQQPSSAPRMSADDLLVRVSFSKNNVYEQEAVIATIKVYTRLEIKDFRVVQQPEFEGFLSEELPVDNRVRLENYNGQNYYAAELKKCLLYPQKSGTLRLNTGKYDVTVVHQEPVSQGFWVTMRETDEHVTTTSNAATLRVTPLPEPRPEGFSGAVGVFSVNAELNPELLRTDEAATYSYIITGTGNIKYIPEPEIAFPPCFDTYTPKTDINARLSGANTTGTYRIDYPIVPQEVGRFEIPARPFIYFNPSTREYVTLPGKSFKVNVARGAAHSGAADRRAVDADISDIRHIKSLESVAPGVPEPVFCKAFYWICYAAALLLLLAVLFIYRRHMRLEADVAGRRLARAGRLATRRLKVAARHMKAHEPDRFYDELARALKGYIGDKLGIAPSQLISDTIVDRLVAYGADEATARAAVDVLNDCEMARFTPDSGADAAMSDMYDRAADAIGAIEKAKKQS